MTHYDAIVIGAGIGGLAAGLMLSHRGRKTLLLESNNGPGGRLSSFQKDGFQVDFGVHVISRSDKGPIGDVLRRVGIPNPITYTHVRPVSSYQGKTFIFPHDLKNMVPDADFKALMAFLGEIRSMSEEKVKEYDDLDLKAFLSQYTWEPFIHACVGNVCSVYLCLPNWLASAGEFMRCLRFEAAARASGYPEGGCSVITNTYSDGIEKFGGEIRLGANVRKIEVVGGRVKGVVVGDNIFQTDMVVSNADIKNTVLNLIGPEYFPADYVEYVKSLEYSWGGPVI
ncbi:MAG: FAD-dependent oxidoreductase, partial [Deltaproteobacteria bacterium]|nr:FAD-dependent oxidoreductase [Deltaproteobacteria bacterium]